MTEEEVGNPDTDIIIPFIDNSILGGWSLRTIAREVEEVRNLLSFRRCDIYIL